MISLTILFFGLIGIFTALPILNSSVVNARGVFLAYILTGALIPAIDFAIQGESPPTFFTYFDNSTIYIALSLTFVFSVITIYLSHTFEYVTPFRKRLIIYTSDNEISIIFSIISIISSAIYIIGMSFIFGGPLSLVIRFYQRISLDNSLANGLSILYFLSFVFSIFAFTFISKSKRILTKCACAAALFLVLVISLSSGGRSTVVLLIFALAYPKIIMLKPGKIIFYSGILLALFGLISFFMLNLRYEAQNATALTDGVRQSGLSIASTGVIFLDSVAAAVEYAKYEGHDFGQLYLNVLGQPFPRALWPDKPLQISVALRDFIFGDTSGGVPPGIIGESYIAFGFFGPLLVAPIFSWLLAWINRVSAVAKFADCKASAATAGILVPLIGYALIRGGFDIAFVRVGIPAFWCFCAYWIARRTRRVIVTPPDLLFNNMRANHRRSLHPVNSGHR